MFEHRMDFNHVGGLTKYFQRPPMQGKEGFCGNDYVLSLESKARSWCLSTFGYVPSLETETLINGQYITIGSWDGTHNLQVGLYFHEEQDAIMFYIAYAQHWVKSSLVLRYCPIAG